MREEKNLERVREIIAGVMKDTVQKLEVDGIAVWLRPGAYGGTVLRVRVIYRGPHDKNKQDLIVHGTHNVTQDIRDRLEEAEISKEISEAYPVVTYLPQDEWLEIKEDEVANGWAA